MPNGRRRLPCVVCYRRLPYDRRMLRTCSDRCAREQGARVRAEREIEYRPGDDD